MAQENKQVLIDAFNFFSSLFVFPLETGWQTKFILWFVCVVAWWKAKADLFQMHWQNRQHATTISNRHSFGKLQHLTQKPDLVATNFKAADQITEGEHADNFVFFLQTKKWQEVVYSLRYLHFICISMHRSSAQPYYLYKVDFLINILYINNTWNKKWKYEAASLASWTR